MLKKRPIMTEKKKSGAARGTGIPRDDQLNGDDLQSCDQAPSAAAASSLAQGSRLDPGIEIADWPNILFPPDGNTSSEELERIGHDPDLDTLVGTIRVKKSAGYSGGPSQGDSTEYITFWADLNNNGNFETCIGTASLEAQDYNSVLKRSLEYSVFNPVNLEMSHHLYQHRSLRSPFLALLLLLRLI